MKEKKQYLSYSQIALWLKSRKQYKKQYFYGIEAYGTDAMRIGTASHNHLPSIFGNRYYEYEKEFDCVINGVRLYGKVDMYSEFSNTIYEFKTGKKDGEEWDEALVNSHLQLHLYYLMHEQIFGRKCYIKLGKIPKNTFYDETNIEWIEYTPNEEVLEATKRLIVQVRSEIDEAYDEFVKSGVEPIYDRDMEALIKLLHDVAKKEERIAFLKNKIKERYKDGIDYDGCTVYPIKKETYDFSKDENIVKIKAFSDEYNALLKDAQDAFKKANQPVKTDISYGFKIK